MRVLVWTLLRDLSLGLCFLWSSVAGFAAPMDGTVYEFDIPEQSLVISLNTLSNQTETLVLFPYDLVKDLAGRQVAGQFTVQQALDVMLTGTGLSGGTSNTGVLTVVPAPSESETITTTERGQDTMGQNRNLLSRFLGVLVAGAAASGQAQETSQTDLTSEAMVEEIVVTGARGRPRTVSDSPVPIDVFNSEALEAVPATDMNDLLTSLIPSFTVSRQSNSDGSTSVRTPALRGLPGNKTLMLVNSRRRHRTAVVPNGGPGSQAADAALIPKMALKSIEVLRDGAAAQYGSDAIAGVINYILKDSASGGAIEVQSGQYYEGDGFNYSVAGNIGLPLADNGFINLTAEYLDQDPTHRGRQFLNPSFDPVAYAAANPEYAAAVDLSKPLHRTGQPEISAFRSIINSGYDLPGGQELYAFGTYASSETGTQGGYRYPGNGQTDLDNPIRLADGREFRFKEIFPGGFVPNYTGIIEDYALTAGTRFDVASINFDLGVSFGSDDFRFENKGIPNPSLGPDSPHEFKTGGSTSEELAFNLDMATDVLESTFYSPVTLNFGLEYRDETFKINEGEPLSWATGPWGRPDPFNFCNDDQTPTATAPTDVGLNCADDQDPVYTVLKIGSGLDTPDTYAGTYGRDNYSAYIEATADVTERLFVDIAGRFEDYSDFGSEFSWKTAFLYQLNDVYNIRGSVGTGFRAPSVGQLHLANARITFIDGAATNIGTFPATHPAATFLGASPLQPELAENIAVGTTAGFRNGLSLSLDYYRIDIDDTIYMSSRIPVTDAIREELVAADVHGALTLGNMRFFQNSFDSRTSGIDLVASYSANWDNGTSTQFSASANTNKYEIKDVRIANFFNEVDVRNFEEGQPNWRGIFTANHRIGAFSLFGRLTVNGPYEYQRTTAPYPIQKYKVESMLDLEARYSFNSGYNVAIGGRNVTDNYPARDKIDSLTNSSVYRDGPVSYQGGYYYMKLTKDF